MSLFVRTFVLLTKMSDWALRRSIANSNEKLRDEGDFIIDRIRQNNYLRTGDILTAMNSGQLTVIQAAIDRSEQTRIIAERMSTFFATKKRLLESRKKVHTCSCVVSDARILVYNININIFQLEYLKTIANEYSCTTAILLSTFYLSVRLSNVWIVTKRNMTQQI